MSTSTLAQFESGHTDMVHDAEFDYYGKRLATCSSDRTIKIFDINGEQVNHVTDLVGHEGPVWEVVWSHPKFGNLLASCGFDNRIIIWKEVSDNVWQQIYQSAHHAASVNSISWAPFELGLILAAASSDGTLSILTYQQDGSWLTELIENAHPAGANSVTWSPAPPPGSLVSSKPPGHPIKRLASAGCDSTIKIWAYNDSTRQWQQDGQTLTAHTDWVRDVAWAPNFGLPSSTIASAGQDGRLIVWMEQENSWSPVVVHEFGASSPVWRVSWSSSGNILSATDASKAVTLWKEVSDGVWQQVRQNAGGSL